MRWFLGFVLCGQLCFTILPLRSEDVVDSLQRIVGNIPNSERVYVLTTLAKLYTIRNPHKGLDVAKKAQRLAQELQNAPLQIKLWNILGRLYWEQGQNDQAQESHFTALTGAEELHDTIEIATALTGIGRVFHIRKKHRQALQYQFNALPLAQAHKERLLTAQIFNSIGTSYRDLKLYDSALSFFHRSLAEYREYNLTEQIYMPLFNIGYMLYLRNSFEDASEYVFQALTYALRENNNRVIAESYLTVSDIAQQQRNYRYALEFAYKALQIADSVGLKPTMAETYWSLSEIYRNQRQYQEALHYRDLYRTINDSLISVQSSMTIAELQARYSLEKQERLSMQERERQKFIQNSLLVGCGLLMAIILLLGLLYRIKRRSEQNLQQTNAEILRQQALLEEQARTIELANTEYQEANQALQDINYLLDQEKELSESLLLNMMPHTIAARLKAGEQLIAEHFQGISVLFADIVGFTKLSAQMQPGMLVTLLDTIFSEFDRLVEQYGVEKIKTIGDSYMVVGGVGECTPNHIEANAMLGLAMCATIQRLSHELGVMGLTVRVGLHTGSAVAGVIGKKKFSYDIWGDTVNIASRMESHGEPGKVHCSQAIFEHLREAFCFQERGWLEIKGMGEMKTYFVTGKRERVPETQ